MIEILQQFQLQPFDWVLIAVTGLLIGMTKTGLSGASMVMIPVMAAIFGGRLSAGIVLPMLITGDIFAVIYYKRHAVWKYVVKLLPWTGAGLLLGLVVGDFISDAIFKMIMGAVLVSSVTLMLVREIRTTALTPMRHPLIAPVAGILAGFSTMIGNAAGPIMSIYLLSMGLPKNGFIGTAAWFFFIVNLTKVPLHALFWDTIRPETLVINLMVVPVILLGAFIGFRVVKYIPERGFRYFIIIMTLVSSVRLFL